MMWEKVYKYTHKKTEQVYYIWFYAGVYQCTNTDTLPTNDAGYYDLDALLKLKGLYRNYQYDVIRYNIGANGY